MITTKTCQQVPANKKSSSKLIVGGELQHRLQSQLIKTQQKVAEISAKLEEKNNIINSLKSDLEHAIEQISLLQRSKSNLPAGKPEWMDHYVAEAS